MKLLRDQDTASPDATEMACPRCKRRFEFHTNELIAVADGSKNIVCPACSQVITVTQAIPRAEVPHPSDEPEGEKDASEDPPQFAEGTPENPIILPAQEPIELKSTQPNVGEAQPAPQKTTSNAKGSTSSDNKQTAKSNRGSKSTSAKSAPAKKAAPKKSTPQKTKGTNSKGSKNTKASKRK